MACVRSQSFVQQLSGTMFLFGKFKQDTIFCKMLFWWDTICQERDYLTETHFLKICYWPGPFFVCKVVIWRDNALCKMVTEKEPILWKMVIWRNSILWKEVIKCHPISFFICYLVRQYLCRKVVKPHFSKSCYPPSTLLIRVGEILFFEKNNWVGQFFF